MRVDIMLAVWSSFTEEPDTFIASIYNPVGFQFETLIDGGFGTASFSIPAYQQLGLKVYAEYLGYHLVAFDFYGRRVYEGRIDTVDFTTEGVAVGCVGYYGHASDLTFGMIYDGSTPKTATDIIKDIVALADDIWSPDISQLQETYLDITPQDFTGEAKLADAVQEVLKYGGDPNNDNHPYPYHLKIWEGRRAFLNYERIPDIGDPDWFLSLNDLSGSTAISLSRSRSEVYNKIQVLYDDAGVGQTFTDWFEDLASQQRYGIREGSVNIGQADSTIADLVGAMMIRAYARPEQITRIVVQGMPTSFGGVSDFPYMLRAGQVITIIDAAYSAGYNAADGAVLFSSGTIARTSYSFENGQVDLEFGKRSVAMDILLARIGVSGGSVR